MKYNWLELVQEDKITNVVTKHWTKFGITDSTIKSIDIYKESDDQHITITHTDPNGRIGKTTYTEYGADTINGDNVALWAKLFTSVLPDSMSEKYLDAYRKHILETIVSEKNDKIDQISTAYDYKIQELENMKNEAKKKIIDDMSESYKNTIGLFTNISISCKRKTKEKE